jgi:hypothetical protein
MTAAHLAAKGGGYEFQRQNNFEVDIYDVPGMDVLKLALQSAALPSVALEEVALPYLNGQAYAAGRATYETMPLVFRDFVDQNVRVSLNEWWLQHYDPDTEAIGRASTYKKDGQIILYDPAGEAVQTYSLFGCWMQNFVGGTLDYTAADVVTIEATIRFDRAKLDV